MRAAVAVLFTCLLMWLQTVAALSPCFVAQAGSCCCCCACGSQFCCLPQSTPGPTPSPTAVPRVGDSTESIPLPAPSIVPPPPPASPTASLSPRIASIPAPPLFLRHRALLI